MNEEPPSAPLCICTRLRRAARETGRLYDAALAEAGIGVAQFALLRAVERLGAPTLNALAAETRLDASTLGRNVRVLERDGLVAFGPGKDRRTRVVRLTERGRATLDAAAGGWAAAQARLERRLGPGGREALFAVLETLEAEARPEQEARA
jgi:DNA-binding MarR family transcriptional regulator